MMEERDWDRLLRIKTSGRDDSHANQVYYPYEPTSYAVLARLAASGYLGKRNLLLDYGCGKLRVGIFLAYEIKCRSIGIEVDKRLYEAASANVEASVAGGRVQVVCAKAEGYTVPAAADRFYFFNPFSVEILQRVVGNIIESYYDEPRELYLFFYYPSEQYLAYLLSVPELSLVEEIDCRDVERRMDVREKICVFCIGGANIRGIVSNDL